MLKEYDAIIFDFDGTLYDNYKIGKALVLNNPFQMMKMAEDRKIRKELKGKDFPNGQEFFNEYYRLLSKKTGNSVKKAEEWYNKKYLPSMIKVLHKKFKAQPGIDELFDYLKNNNIKTAIFSDYNLVEKRMQALGINPSISENLFSSVELGGLKPAPGPFLKIAEILGVEPSKILVVGDRNDTDGQGARNCGMSFIQLKIKGTKESAEELDHPLYDWKVLCNFLMKKS